MGQPIKSAGKVMMTAPLHKGQLKRSNVLKKINIEGNVEERREEIVCCKAAALKGKGFELKWSYGERYTRLDGQREIEMIDMRVLRILK